MLDYDLAERGDLSLYEYLYRRIRDDILAGTLDPDDRLPSKRVLAAQLGVSLVTVEAAYRQLVTEGYCKTRPRSGYFVSRLPQAASLSGQPRRSLAAPPAKKAEFDFTRPTADTKTVSRVWGRALRAVLTAESDEEIYGDQPAKGTLRLRAAITDRLRKTRGLDADPDRIVIGAGSQLLAATLVQVLQPKSGIALEDPGYARLQRIYASLGLAVSPVGLDDEGIGMEGLRSSGADVVHVMPSHQYPTGIVTSIARRYELLSWASEAPGRYIIEDDYDATFRMAGRPVASLASIDAEGRVVYLNTFSKSLGPAIRMAFMVLPEDLSERWEESAGFYSNTVSVVDQVALAKMIESGDYERHVNRYRKSQRDVRDALIGELSARAPQESFQVEQEDSGLHFVLVVPGANEDDFARRALQKGVALTPLGSCSLSQAPQQGPARFAMQYGGIGVDAARRAAKILAGLM